MLCMKPMILRSQMSGDCTSREVIKAINSPIAEKGCVGQ